MILMATKKKLYTSPSCYTILILKKKKKKKNQRVPRLFSHLKNYRVSNLFKQ